MIGQNREREADVTKEHRSQTRLVAQLPLKFEISTKRERGCERSASGISHSSYARGRGEAAAS